MMCKVLIFGCIAAVILMTAAYGAPFTTELLSTQEEEELLRAAISDLAQLEDITNDFLGFYTPNDKQECNWATLACYLKELEVLRRAVKEKDKIHIVNIIKNLQSFKASNSSNSTCNECESSDKKMFPEFRQELKSFLQSMLKEIV